MIEWINSFSSQERWLYGIIVSFTFGIVLVIIRYILAGRIERRRNLVNAALAFRQIINTEIFNDISGHSLNNMLLGVTTNNHVIEGEFTKHKRAVNEFRIHLGCVNRWRLNKAWKKYHGGNEQAPDFFMSL